MTSLQQGRMKLMQRRPWLRLSLTFFLSFSLLLLSPLTSAAGPAPTAAPPPKATPAAPPPKSTPAAPQTLPKSPPAPPPKPSASSAPPPASSPPPVKAAAATPPPKPVASAPPPKAASPPPAASSPAPAAGKKPKPSTTTPPVSSPGPAPPTSPSTGSPSPSASPSPKAAPTAKAKPPVASLSPKAPPPAKKPPATSPPPVDIAPSSGPSAGPSSVNANQLAALRALEVKYSPSDPCHTPGDDILCNKAGTTIIGLTVRNCSKTAVLTLKVLENLAGVQVLQFVDCPLSPPSHVPKALVKTVTNFFCTASLGRTGTNERLPRLKGDFLSQLINLNEIMVTEVDISGKGLYPITQSLTGLTNLTISKTSLGGLLPRNTWPLDVKYIDVSNNQIRGSIPTQMRHLTQLKHLDLSENQLKGVIPNLFDSLNSLQHIDLHGNQLSGPIPGSIAQLFNCSYLDLSNNKLNGSIPANLTNIKTLRYLDLSQNQFTGEIKFNSSFLKKLKVLKIAPNPNLCYNHTAIKSKFLTGIKNCLAPVDNSYFAPAPAPSMLEDLNARSGGGGGLSKGAAAGITIVVLLAAAAVVFVGCRIWKARQSSDQFISMRP